MELVHVICVILGVTLVAVILYLVVSQQSQQSQQTVQQLPINTYYVNDGNQWNWRNRWNWRHWRHHWRPRSMGGMLPVYQ